MIAPTKKGWCPGALRPMPTGDGLLVRVKPSCGRLSLEAAKALGEIARSLGNGGMEISQRANLQLRGFREPDLPALWARLDALGLIDPDAAIEARRNVLASPFSDLDPTSAIDVAPHVAALEEKLRDDPRFDGLPAKFSLAVDGGGRFGLGDAEADLSFHAERAGDEVRWAVRMRDGAPRFTPLAAMPETAASLAHEAAARRGTPAPEHEGADAPVGLVALGETRAAIVAPAFGRWNAAAWLAFVEAAQAARASGLRLMTHRRIGVVGLGEAGARSVLAAAEAAGFVVDGDDVRLRIAACPGAPSCDCAARDVLADARVLASGVPAGRGVALHLSGCVKGCARGSATALTLIARDDGYDAVFGGRADGVPAAHVGDLAAARALVVQKLAAA